MSGSLAEVSEEVKSTFAELRACQAREDRNRYIIYKLEKMIDVEKIGPKYAVDPFEFGAYFFSK